MQVRGKMAPLKSAKLAKMAKMASLVKIVDNLIGIKCKLQGERIKATTLAKIAFVKFANNLVARKQK